MDFSADGVNLLPEQMYRYDLHCPAQLGVGLNYYKKSCRMRREDGFQHCPKSCKERLKEVKC